MYHVLVSRRRRCRAGPVWATGRAVGQAVVRVVVRAVGWFSNPVLLKSQCRVSWASSNHPKKLSSFMDVNSSKWQNAMCALLETGNSTAMNVVINFSMHSHK